MSNPETTVPEGRIDKLQALEARLVKLASALQTFGLAAAWVTVDEATREIQHLIDHRDSPAETIIRGPTW